MVQAMLRGCWRSGWAAALLAAVAGCIQSYQSTTPVVTSTAAAPAAQPAAKTEEKEPLPERLLTEEELADGWISLFDGQTLFGWKAGSEADWRVENGAIVVTKGEKGLLCTTAQFSDYNLRLEFRCDERTNSGVFLHTPLKPADPAVDCYELNIAPPDNPFPTGGFVKRKKATGKFDKRDWQEYEVTVRGGEITVKIDSEVCLEYTDPQPLRRGQIGLQLNEGRAEFRNIRLKPLGLTDLFNGLDLTGWKQYPDLASKFTVAGDGSLHVANGRGQLETEASFGDFVMQFECQTHAPRLNSGIFFRCIPGELMNGYECQIHNGFKNGDRRQPEDCGTGGIFRRQNARFVAADDQQWFTTTIAADGPHVAVWVNGIPVTAWTDERPQHANPRQGSRVEPGTIMIQGHDPTTDISFRKLRAAETAKRQVAAAP